MLFFFYPISFFGFHLDFQLLKHICCTRGMWDYVASPTQVRGKVSVLILGPQRPKGPYHPCLKVVKKVLQQIARMAAQDQPSHCLTWPGGCGARWPGTVVAFHVFLSVKSQVISPLLHRESNIASVSRASKYLHTTISWCIPQYKRKSLHMASHNSTRTSISRCRRQTTALAFGDPAIFATII
jgi:hypothetical protein